MAGAKIQPLLRFSGWPRGLWNRGKEEAVPLDEAGKQTALRGAVNIDLDDLGKPSRRSGYQLLSALPGLHSLWSHPRFPLMLAAQGNSLLAFDARLTVSSVPAIAGPAHVPIAFALGSEDVYFCNPSGSGQIEPTGSVRAWATESPGGQPTATVNLTVGGLAAGVYQVAITFVDDTGRESGATLPVEVNVPANGGISLSNFPIAQRPETVWARVYCSEPNGATLAKVTNVPLPASALLIGAHVGGELLDKLFLSELPPGQCLAFHAGILHSALGPVHSWSKPMMHGLTQRSTDQARYDADVTLLVPSGQGDNSGLFLAVAAGAGKSNGRTYFLSGANPKDWRRKIAYAYGAVPGTLTYVPAADLGLDTPGEVPVWYSDSGQMVAGLPNGDIIELHGAAYDGPSQAEHGATALRDIGGTKHLVTVLRGGSATGFAASDSADAEVWYRGARIR